MEATDTEIAYQNKDIFSKFMSEKMRNKSFKAYGLDLPEIVRVEPTNLPTIKAMELRIDNLFELADGTFAIVDYESSYDEKDKLKYANYLTGVLTKALPRAIPFLSGYHAHNPDPRAVQSIISYCCKCLRKIFNNIVPIFRSDRQTDGVRLDALL